MKHPRRGGWTLDLVEHRGPGALIGCNFRARAFAYLNLPTPSHAPRHSQPTDLSSAPLLQGSKLCSPCFQARPCWKFSSGYPSRLLHHFLPCQDHGQCSWTRTNLPYTTISLNDMGMSQRIVQTLPPLQKVGKPGVSSLWCIIVNGRVTTLQSSTNSRPNSVGWGNSLETRNESGSPEKRATFTELKLTKRLDM